MYTISTTFSNNVNNTFEPKLYLWTIPLVSFYIKDQTRLSLEGKIVVTWPRGWNEGIPSEPKVNKGIPLRGVSSTLAALDSKQGYDTKYTV